MDLKNTKLYVPEDLWQIIQNILVYECGYCFLRDFKKSDWHPYLYIGSDNYLTIGDDFEYFKVNLNKEISYKDILKMNNTEKYIKVDLNTAKEWYKGDNETLRTLAIQAFTEKKLKEFNFRDIKTWEDALTEYCKENDEVISNQRGHIEDIIKQLNFYSPASAAMFKVNIIRQVLNKGYDLSLTENVVGKNYTYHPVFRLVKACNTTHGCKIGTINHRNKLFNVYTCSFYGGGDGLSNYFGNNVTDICIDSSFFGCATEEIAAHFGKYFGMLILKAMYSDVIKDIKFN